MYTARALVAAGASAAALAFGVSFLVMNRARAGDAPPADPQAAVHEMGHHVMPFDLAKTTHVFEMTDSGGVQDVVAKDVTDSAQIALIRQHLQHEATRFQAGNFADPSALHGSDMPGIADLAKGAARVTIAYAELPNGGRITFTTSDQRLTTAIHRWFGAQLSDHGADAKYR